MLPQLCEASQLPAVCICCLSHTQPPSLAEDVSGIDTRTHCPTRLAHPPAVCIHHAFLSPLLLFVSPPSLSLSVILQCGSLYVSWILFIFQSWGKVSLWAFQFFLPVPRPLVRIFFFFLPGMKLSPPLSLFSTNTHKTHADAYFLTLNSLCTCWWNVD